MTRTPLYRSLRDSFSKDIYMPTCGIISAPTVVLQVNCAEQLSALSCATPPQNVILPIRSDLTVCGVSLYEVLSACSRSVPILRLDSASTADALAEFTDENHVADAILCTDYAQRELLAYAYGKMPLLRGMLDCRGRYIETDRLPSQAVSCGATSVILDGDAADSRIVHSLQQRYIHVIAPDTLGFDTMATRGVNGIITSDLEAAYGALAKFPEGTMLRHRNLVAHKGFQNNGAYSENTITSVVAAARNHFDGAEIDVKLTSDDVPVVMHNLNTKGLFDCEETVTEQSDFAFLSSLRRIEFPDESIDRFEDLMFCMKQYQGTPVHIEFKPHKIYHNVEKMVALADDILQNEKCQSNAVGLMGDLAPGLRYVHRRLPYLPMAHCEGGKSIPPAPTDRTEAEDRLFRIALITEGCAAAYNPEDVNINRLFNEYAKFRMLHVFVWSRSWTLSPSKWETNGPLNDKTYLAGFDGWTTDHGEKFLDYPIAIEPTVSEQPTSAVKPLCRLIHRDGSSEAALCSVLPLSGDVTVNDDGSFSGHGKVRLTYVYRIDLHFGDSYNICSAPFEMSFE